MGETRSPLDGLDAAIKAAGGSAALARALNRSKSVIGNWRRRDGGIPASVVPAAARATGLAPHVLRPDLFDVPDAAPATPHAKVA